MNHCAHVFARYYVEAFQSKICNEDLIEKNCAFSFIKLRIVIWGNEYFKSF